jgi:hypothetical protein
LTRAIRTTFSKLKLSSTTKCESHMLRRGAAVSMHAVHVSLPRILSWGAWKTEFSFRPYIKDRAWIQATEEDFICFDHMLQH